MAAAAAAAIPGFLEEQVNSAPERLQPLVLQFEELWERKLWHQLTDALVEYFKDDASEKQRLDFYKVFIEQFADKINQLKLVDLALQAAETCKDNKEKLAFLEKVAKKVNHEDSQDAFVFATIAVASTRLSLRDLDAARRDLDTAERTLDTFDSVETVVHAKFYDTNAAYFQHRSDFAAYYRNALLYLACIDLQSLDSQDRAERAYRLAIAALISKDIYNFGELLLHPVLDALTEKDEDGDENELAWLRELLFAFNSGDLQGYDRMSSNISGNKLLSAHKETLRQKIYLAALTEAVFRRPPHDRTMSFQTISGETKVKVDEIEHLVMKALSLGLLRGTIDQVDEVAHINWVQPKVLNMQQIGNMRERLRDWDGSVNQLGNWIEKAGQDVWAA